VKLNQVELDTLPHRWRCTAPSLTPAKNNLSFASVVISRDSRNVRNSNAEDRPVLGAANLPLKAGHMSREQLVSTSLSSTS
jgi:hypothetical protein